VTQPVTPNELKALVDTLHFNNYFIGFVAKDYRLDKDSMKGTASRTPQWRAREPFAVVAVSDHVE
jgi:hypothetical protein